MPSTAGMRWDRRSVRSDGREAASGAAQFMPFAALRGLDALMEECAQAHAAEERHELTPEECQELDECLTSLRKGARVRCRVWERGRSVAVEGTVERMELPLRRLRVGERWVSLDALLALEDMSEA